MLSDKKYTWRNVHVALALYLCLAMLLYTITRILFFVFNRHLFEATSITEFAALLLPGLRFDLSAVLYTNLLFMALMLIPFRFRYKAPYQKLLKYTFIVTNSIALAANLIDIVYYRYTMRRTTWSVLREFANENGGALAGSFIVDFWYIPLLWLLLVAFMVWLYGKIKMEQPPRVSSWLYYPAHTAVFGLVVFLSIAGMRGGFAHSTRPITLSNAGEYVKRPNEMYLVLNTPFSMLRTIGKTNFSKVDYFPEQELNALYSPIHLPADTAAFQKKNVVIIVLESFGKEMMGSYNGDTLQKDGYKTFTPFLDKLMQESKVYRHSFTNGQKSIDALPSILTSIPSIQEPFVLTPYASNNLPSLPRTLGSEGYHTAFFHGAPNGSMGFKAFMNLIGVQEYYGKDEYNNDADFDGMWGIWDDKFLQFTVDKLNTFQEPFMSTVFTLSSHHPYKLPDQYKGKFAKGPLPVFETISYTDMALQHFFEKASKMPWYNNTLFVISADHPAAPRHYPEFNTALGAFAAPILFYAPGDPAFKGTEQRVVQQLDVMPTILSYLNYSKPYFSFGKSKLDTTAPDFAVNYSNGVYQWIEDSLLLQFNGNKTIALYNYQQDRMLQHDLKTTLPEKRAQLENRVKAFIQQYNNRMIENRLQVK
ncbi:sulfatase-like hydrolase/transferase [Pontibacter sp. Tf4]|uniref:LTA synthase family protein n=1 Tax=Pontibacter sp. Tf4 TaxID=2761620 RepID=UPI0016237DD9|nr:alkaline phosphatase family protein [Pontibacter sp. Tf4]MBB6609954.1 sulfatase-like hydrolase/transferase [Pontibacter sp. Tf4]